MNLKLWNWCYNCNRKHRKYNMRLSRRCRSRIEPLTNHSENHHIFKHVGTERGDKVDYVRENGKLVKLGYPVYSLLECVVCKVRAREKIGW